jgi:hypothetical protein
MSVYKMCQWLQSTLWATGLRESLHMYPALYTLHIFGFMIMVTATRLVVSVSAFRIVQLNLLHPSRNQRRLR